MRKLESLWDSISGVPKIFSLLWKNPSLFRPSLSLSSVSEINVEYLKEKKIECVIFDKDNTVTDHLGFSFATDSIEKKIRQIQGVFGYEKVVILSNSFTHDYIEEVDLNKKASNFERIQKIRVLLVQNRKPFNFEDVKKHLEFTSNSRIAVIGDRLSTDILFANLNGCHAIKVEPCNPKSEPLNIKFARLLESTLAQILISRINS